MRGDYREQYNYQLGANRGSKKPNQNVGFLPKLYLGINVGDEYSEQAGNNAIKNLYATSLFENINIQFNR